METADTDSTLNRGLPPGSRCTNGITNSLASSLGLLYSEIEFKFSRLIEVIDDSVIPSCLDQLVVSFVK
jgi:hypothetical protein